jgi:mono/diheme cytochrome c family protein
MAGALTDNRARSGEPGHDRGDRGDRAAKLALLAGSLVTLAFLVGAMLRENYFTEWRHRQREFRQLLLKSPDERLRRRGETFAVAMRQVDLPQFGSVDRCVACHQGIDDPALADAPLPHRCHSGDHLKHHPVERYGCTVCHQGQGAATNFHEAKATDVFWDYPLLPARLTEASCGACHAADSPLMAERAPKLAQGRRLFLERGCQSCHKLDGVGGQLGPALDGVGSKIKHQLPMAHVAGEHTLANWLTQHFDQPQAIVPGSKMRPPRLTAMENEALTIYMLSLRSRELPRNYLPADRIAALDDAIHHKPTDPVVLYARFCANCHADGTFAPWDRFFNRFVPAVRGPGLRALADKQYLKEAIVKGRPGTLMPAWGKGAGGLTDEQLERLVNYLVAGDGRPPQTLMATPAAGGGDPKRGGELFAQHCAGCHGGGRIAPSLGNAAFLRSASDDFLALTIANGRQDTPMPAFQRDGADGLTDAEVRDLVTYVRSLGRTNEPRPSGSGPATPAP